MYKNNIFIDSNKPYRAQNMIVNKNEILSESGFIKVRVITDLGLTPLKVATVIVN